MYATISSTAGNRLRENTQPYWKELNVVNPAARVCVIKTVSNARLPPARVLP